MSSSSDEVPAELAGDDLDAPDELSDDELVALVRAGDSIAYGELWRRHAGPAMSVARTFVSLDPEDLVSEAFARVLRAIRSGGGPTAGFRPYLIMSVRNVGRRWYSRDTTIATDDFEFVVDPDAREGELSAVEEFEGGAAMAAFRSLPTRWQEVLWYSEVDGLKPREISPILGLAPNAVSSLIVRARKSLRDAWISAQLAVSTKPECQAALKEMGAYTRDALSDRARAKLELHLQGCPTCPKALDEARSLATIAAAVLPAVAGITGAAGYISSLQAPPMSVAMAAAEGAMSPSAESAPASPGAPADKDDRKPQALLLLLLLLALVAAALVGWALLSGGDEPKPADGAPSAPPASGPSTAPSSAPSPAPTPVASETPPAVDIALPDTLPRNPAAAIARPVAPAVPPVDPGAPVPAAPSAPTASSSQLDGRMYPRLSGSDGAPGALVEALGPDGSVLGSSRVKTDGTWSIHLTGAAPGSHTVTVRQTLSGRTSTASAPITYTVTGGPLATAPLDGATVSASRFNFRLSEAAGTVVQRQIVGVTGVQTLRVPSSGAWNEYLSVPAGERVILLRYAAPDSGDFGPWTTTTITAQ